MTLIEPPRQAAKETRTAPYDALAPLYESFVGSDSHAGWLSGLVGLAAEHGVTGGRALDVGCGTGLSLQSLVAAGFTISGCDPSPRMLDEARRRLGPDVDLAVAALPALPDGPAADLVTAVNDVLNYVPAADLDAAVAALARRLAPGGVLLFDANTPQTYAGFFGATFCRTVGGSLFVWESLPVGDDGAYRADLHTFQPAPGTEDLWIRGVSRHVQHHHPHARVTAALAAAGLELLDVQGQHDDGRRDPTCDERIHAKRIYVARAR